MKPGVPRRYCVPVPGKPDVGGVNVLGVVYLLVVVAVLFLPIFLGGHGSSGDDSGSDSGGDWPPGPPRGGPPLPDADPAAMRLRDHGRLRDRAGARRRRGAPERPGRRRPAKHGIPRQIQGP